MQLPWRRPASRLEGEGGTRATSRWRGGTLSSTGTRRETWRRGGGRPACLENSLQNAPQRRCSRSPMRKACSALRGASNLCGNLCLRLPCALLLLAGWALRLTRPPPRLQTRRAPTPPPPAPPRAPRLAPPPCTVSNTSCTSRPRTCTRPRAGNPLVTFLSRPLPGLLHPLHCLRRQPDLHHHCPCHLATSQDPVMPLRPFPLGRPSPASHPPRSLSQGPSQPSQAPLGLPFSAAHSAQIVSTPDLPRARRFPQSLPCVLLRASQ